MKAWRNRNDDNGLTLIELLVSMTIMAVFLTIFTGAMVMMYRVSNQTNAVADTATQVNNAFSRLDSMVRYASAIAKPSASGSDPTVAWQTVATGQTTCSQLKLSQSSRQLQLRNWTVTSNGATTNVSAWQPLASSVDSVDPSTGASFNPFTVPNSTPIGDPDADSTISQQLRIRLTATSPSGEANQATALDVTFTALNSDANADASSVCTPPRGTP